MHIQSSVQKQNFFQYAVYQQHHRFYVPNNFVLRQIMKQSANQQDQISIVGHARQTVCKLSKRLSYSFLASSPTEPYQYPKSKNQSAIIEEQGPFNPLQKLRIQKIFQKQSSYYLIPGIFQPSFQLLSPWIIIKYLFKFSVNRIIDITLPYVQLNSTQRIEIDLTDNFVEQRVTQKQALQEKTLARYIIYNKQLIGIKTDTTKGWPRGKCVSRKLPYDLLKYNTNEQQSKQIIDLEIYPKPFIHKNFPGEKRKTHIPVGDFFIIIPSKAKIGLLFQQEILVYPDILKDLLFRGCQVFAVVDNLNIAKKKIMMQNQVNRQEIGTYISLGSNQANDQKHLPVPQRLQQLARDHKIVAIYTGYRMSVKPTQVYWAQPFIVQDDRIIYLNTKKSLNVLSDFKFNATDIDTKQPEKSFLHSHVVRKVCNLAITKQRRICLTPDQIRRYIQNNKDKKHLSISGVQLSQQWQNVVTSNLSRFSKIGRELQFEQSHYDITQIEKIDTMDYKHFLNNNYLSKSVTLRKSVPIFPCKYHLYVWFLFKKINGSNPFILGLPFSQKTYILLALIVDIKKQLKLPLSSLVNFYRLKEQKIKIENLIISNFYKEHKNQLVVDDNIQNVLKRNEKKVVHFYSDSISELQQIKEIVALQKQKIQLPHIYYSSTNLLFAQLPQIFPDPNYPYFRNFSNNEQKIIKASKMKVQRAVSAILGLQHRKQTFQMIFKLLSQKQLTSEQTQETIVTLKQKFDNNITLSPLCIFFVSHNIQEIKNMICDIEIQLNEQRQQSKRIQQNMIDLESQNEMINEQKYQKKKSIEQKIKYAKKKRIEKYHQKILCHSCLSYLNVNFTQRCQTCKNVFCYLCLQELGLDNHRIDNKIIIDRINCAYCNEKCQCSSCKCKRYQQLLRSNQYKIFSHSTQSNHRQKMLIEEERQQDPTDPRQVQRKKREYADPNQCQQCQLMDSQTNGKRPYIVLQCMKCQNWKCYYCAKRKHKANLAQFQKIVKNGYFCYQCTKDQKIMIPQINSQWKDINQLTKINEQIRRKQENFDNIERKIKLLQQENEKLKSQNKNLKSSQKNDFIVHQLAQKIYNQPPISNFLEGQSFQAPKSSSRSRSRSRQNPMKKKISKQSISNSRSSSKSRDSNSSKSSKKQKNKHDFSFQRKNTQKRPWNPKQFQSRNKGDFRQFKKQQQAKKQGKPERVVIQSNKPFEKQTTQKKPSLWDNINNKSQPKKFVVVQQQPKQSLAAKQKSSGLFIRTTQKDLDNDYDY